MLFFLDFRFIVYNILYAHARGVEFWVAALNPPSYRFIIVLWGVSVSFLRVFGLCV